MVKLFKSAPSPINDLNRIVNTGVAQVHDTVNHLLSVGDEAYLVAARIGYSLALKEFMTRVVKRILSPHGHYRSLTRRYTLAKSPVGGRTFSRRKTAVGVGKRKTLLTSGLDNHFKGFRYHKEKNIQTRSKSRVSGESLYKFIQNINLTSGDGLVQTFGGLHKEVYGSIFKEGTGTTKNYLKDARGTRARSVDQVIRERIHLAEGVSRSKGGKRFSGESGKSVGFRKASEQGLVGSKVSYSVANKLAKVLKSQSIDDTVVSLFKVGGVYAGIFAGHSEQGMKLQRMATGNLTRGKRRTPIDPFKEEALAMFDGDLVGGYLSRYIKSEMVKAAEKLGKAQLATALGNVTFRK